MLIERLETRLPFAVDFGLVADDLLPQQPSTPSDIRTLELPRLGMPMSDMAFVPKSRLDVNGDSCVTAIDALWVINALNSDHVDTAVAALDVNGDGFLSPIDALQVINAVNSDGGCATDQTNPSGPQAPPDDNGTPDSPAPDATLDPQTDDQSRDEAAPEDASPALPTFQLDDDGNLVDSNGVQYGAALRFSQLNDGTLLRLTPGFELLRLNAEDTANAQTLASLPWQHVAHGVLELGATTDGDRYFYQEGTRLVWSDGEELVNVKYSAIDGERLLVLTHDGWLTETDLATSDVTLITTGCKSFQIVAGHMYVLAGNELTIDGKLELEQVADFAIGSNGRIFALRSTEDHALWVKQSAFWQMLDQDVAKIGASRGSTPQFYYVRTTDRTLYHFSDAPRRVPVGPIQKSSMSEPVAPATGFWVDAFGDVWIHVAATSLTRLSADGTSTKVADNVISVASVDNGLDIFYSHYDIASWSTNVTNRVGERIAENVGEMVTTGDTIYIVSDILTTPGELRRIRNRTEEAVATGVSRVFIDDTGHLNLLHPDRPAVSTSSGSRGIFNPSNPFNGPINTRFYDPVARISVNGSAKSALGSGTLITAGGGYWLLTARHVLTNPDVETKEGDPMRRNVPVVRPGQLDVYFSKACQGLGCGVEERYTVDRIIEHPATDLALIRLTESPFMRQGIKPVTLPFAQHFGAAGERVAQVGYGLTIPGDPNSSGRRSAGVSRVARVEWNELLQAQSLMYAYVTGQSYILPGDSGGPDFAWTKVEDLTTGRTYEAPVLVGVHSVSTQRNLGSGRIDTPRSGDKSYSVMITPEISDWIGRVINPNCNPATTLVPCYF